MAAVTFLRRLPQQYALTGRRSPTTVTEKHVKSRVIGVPRLADLSKFQPAPVSPTTSLADMVPHKKQTFETIGAGPGIGTAEGPSGITGEAPAPSNLGTLGEVMGNDIAASMFSSGVSGMVPTGLAAYSLNAPVSVAVPALLQSGVHAMFAPFSLANLIGGNIVAGQNATEQGEVAQAMTQNPEIAKAMEVAAYKAQPHSLTSMAKGWAKGTLGLGTPGSSDLVGQLGLGMSTVSKGSEDPFAQESSILSALNPSLAQSPTIIGPQPNLAVPGGGIQGESPTGQSGLGSMGQSPTTDIGSAAAPAPGQGGGGGGGGITGGGPMGTGGNAPTGAGAGETIGEGEGAGAGGEGGDLYLHRTSSSRVDA